MELLNGIRENTELPIDTREKIISRMRSLITKESHLNVINDIKRLTEKNHFELLESLSESIFNEIFKNKKIKKIKLKIEKIDIIKETKSVGIEVVKTKL